MLAKEMANVFAEYDLTIEKITNVVTDGGSAFCKSFRIFGRRNGNTPLEDVELEDELLNDEENDTSEMPFMAHDGEQYVSNVIQFESNDEQHTAIDSDNSDLSIELTINDDQLFSELDQNDPIDSATIELPPHLRCFSHLLNLLSADFDKKLTGNTRTPLIQAISKLHALWVLVRRSS